MAAIFPDLVGADLRPGDARQRATSDARRRAWTLSGFGLTAEGRRVWPSLPYGAERLDVRPDRARAVALLQEALRRQGINLDPGKPRGELWPQTAGVLRAIVAGGEGDTTQHGRYFRDLLTWSAASRDPRSRIDRPMRGLVKRALEQYEGVARPIAVAQRRVAAKVFSPALRWMGADVGSRAPLIGQAATGGAVQQQAARGGGNGGGAPSSALLSWGSGGRQASFTPSGGGAAPSPEDQQPPPVDEEPFLPPEEQPQKANGGTPWLWVGVGLAALLGIWYVSKSKKTKRK